VASLSSNFGRGELQFWEKVRCLSWGLVLLIGVAAGFGVAVLYSAADGSMDPWAAKQITRFAVALILMIGVALVDTRVWFRLAYWAYAAGLVLVIAVDLRGFVGMGAQRWIDLGVIQLQPSALMNVAMLLALSRYFHSLSDIGFFPV
jgi:rod shape determining protein RodA